MSKSYEQAQARLAEIRAKEQAAAERQERNDRHAEKVEKHRWSWKIGKKK